MKAAEVLYTRKLKRTSCREGIIEVMMNAGQALSENEIRERLPGNYDRTTFYRSFKTLEEHKIIHKIVIDNQLSKYTLDNSVTHKMEHAHFFCNDCHTVTCLDSVPVQDVQLPEGFTVAEKEILIKGTCADCKNNSGSR
jgi:Fur family ferric uptake transcriptional regulator